jgi:DNA uptake protein ComE-like DNA-binding protein
LKKWFKKSFKFSNSEEKGRIALLFCFWVFFFGVLTKAYWYPSFNELDETELELIYVDTLTVVPSSKSIAVKGINKLALRKFNPNTVDAEFLTKINVPKNVVRNWLKYIGAGGAFYKSKDVKRLYGLADSTYRQLAPYFDIPKVEVKKAFHEKEKIKKVSPETVTIDINMADSTQFASLIGIGPVFSSRIVRYRSALGGFYSKNQLFEVFGIDSVVVNENWELLGNSSQNVEPININTIEFKSLLRHPYFSYKQVKTILNYRKQHGDFEKKNDLLKIVVLDSIWFQKVEPYIVIE